MHVGTAYYPEHWPAQRWPEDARLMREAGFNVVRLAEFAWGRMEPAKGRFDFAWLDSAIDILAGEGLSIILGTPTEAMPPWMASADPECLATREDGRRIPYGGRRDACMTTPVYRAHGRRIVQAMAEHYADHPAVIGWQIDNEFSGPYCYCDICTRAYQQFLADRFKTIAALNQRMGTSFWSHDYSDWNQIPLPRGFDGNPGLKLEHLRFHSRQIVSFQHEQLELLRRLAPRQFITHNMCGLFLDETDYYELGRDLDFAGLDYYYNNSSWTNRFNVAAYEQAAMDFTRSIKKKPFWVLETPSGPIGAGRMLRNLRPLEMRRMNFQALGHGADGLLWFRWRTCRWGAEQLTHGILGHDGVPGRRYRDVQTVAGEFRRLGPILAGSNCPADVAIIYTFDNRWAFNTQPHAKGFDYLGHLLQYHRALKREGVNVDFVNDRESLDAYRLIVLPAGLIVTDDLADRLRRFVQAGGVLLATMRSGVRDTDNTVTDATLPGLLRELAGVRIEEYETVLDPLPVQFGDELGGETHAANTFCEWLVPETAQPLAHYLAPHLANVAAITRNDYGSGQTLFVATAFENDASVDRLIAYALQRANIHPLIRPPQGVGITIRTRGDSQWIFLLNHNDDPVIVDLTGIPPTRDLLTDRSPGDQLELPAGEVSVLQTTLR